MKDDITNSEDFLGMKVRVTMDRMLGQKHPKYEWSYPLNYGFIEGTRSPDGEELDAYVIGVDTPVATFEGICVAIIKRENDDDDKLVVVPKEIASNVSDEMIRNATHFQEQYFKSIIVR